MSADWIEINAKGPGKNADEAASVLIGAGSPGVLEDAPAGAAVGSLLSHSTWEQTDSVEAAENAVTPSTEVSYRAYLSPDEPGRIEGVRKELKKLGWTFSSAFFKDRDWSVKWRYGLKPVRVTSGGYSIIIKPTWRKAAKKPGDIMIEMDPGMAFGTGGHATTKMCLKAMKRLLERHKDLRGSLLDVGTGTGILAIAARKLKVRKAVGTDIDKVALKVARKNISLNRTTVALSSRPLEKIPGTFSIVVANILAGELIRLSEPLLSKISPGGFLILSGILREEADRVKEAFTASGLRYRKTYISGEWAALVFDKPGKA